MAITAKQVKALRDATGAGMMDCKKALKENEGDFDAAKTWLQKKGIADSQKRAGRSASEGQVASFVDSDGRRGLLIELNCETDFVARNEEFQGLLNDLGMLALDRQSPTVAVLLEADWDGKPVAEHLLERSGVTGERLVLSRLAWVRIPQGFNGRVVSYIHAGGQVGVIVGGTAQNDDDANNDGFVTVLRDVAMHAAAMDPQVVSSDRLDPNEVKRQEDILRAQALESGKPAEIVDKMVIGRINKWKKEVALLDQPFVKDQDLTVAKYVAKAANDLSGPIQVTDFARFKVGEGDEE